MFLYCLTYNRDKFFTVRLCLDFYYMACASFTKKELDQIGILITIDWCQSLGCIMLET